MAYLSYQHWILMGSWITVSIVLYLRVLFVISAFSLFVDQCEQNKFRIFQTINVLDVFLPTIFLAGCVELFRSIC